MAIPMRNGGLTGIAATRFTASIGTRKLNSQSSRMARAKPSVAARAKRRTSRSAAESPPVMRAGAGRAAAISVQVAEVGDEADPQPADGVGQGAFPGVDHQARLRPDPDPPGLSGGIHPDPHREPLRLADPAGVVLDQG